MGNCVVFATQAQTPQKVISVDTNLVIFFLSFKSASGVFLLEETSCNHLYGVLNGKLCVYIPFNGMRMLELKQCTVSMQQVMVTVI